MCSVGIHDIISFTDHEVCNTCTNHTPIKVMVLKEKAVEDLVKLVLMRLNRTYSILEELLDSSSVVCFAAVIPCDPIRFFEMAARNHSPKSHAIISPELRSTLNILKGKIQLVCDRVNKQLSKLTPLPSFWDIMCSYHQDRNLKGRIFEDGLNIMRLAAKQLSFRLNRFLQELFFGVEINNTFIEFNHEQEVIVVGDSRLREIQNMWSGNTPKFYCEPDMGFYNFEEFIRQHLVGLKNKIVLVCLGLNDLVKFVDDDEFPCENHDPIKKAISLCHKFEITPEAYVDKVMSNVAKCFNAFKTGNSSLMFFATVYPIHIDIYLNHQLNIHKKDTGHIISAPKNISKLKEDLKKAVGLLNNHLKYLGYNLLSPVWDMYNIVCRGNERTSLSTVILKDGIYPSEQTAEELVRSYHRFLNEKLSQDSKEDIKKYKFPTKVPPPDVKENFSVFTSYPAQVPEVTRSVTQKEKFVHQAPEAEKGKKQEVQQAPLSNELKLQRPEGKSLTEPKSHSSAPCHHKERESPLREQRRSSPGSRRSSQSCENDRNTGLPRHPDKYKKTRYSRSPERFLRTRVSRSPEKRFRHRYSGSPDRSYRVSGSPNRLSRVSRSPDRPAWSRRSPRRDYRVSRYPQYSRNDSPPRHWDYSERKSYQNFDSKQITFSKFLDSMNAIKKECQREKSHVIREALSDLCTSHVRECEMYLKKPDAHPDYAKEYRIFLDNKKRSILELGGDPEAFDFISAWGDHWPGRMFDLFEKGWKLKKGQCVRMLVSKRRRSSSSSSSSSTSSSHKQKTHSKKRSGKHVKAGDYDQKSKGHWEDRDKWQPLASRASTKIDEKIVKDSDINVVEPRYAERIQTETSMSQCLSQEDLGKEITKKKIVKVVEVFGILAYMRDKLGVFGMPVNVLYEKAVELEKKGLDPNQILDDEETATLLGMLSDKLRSIIEEEDLSAIQKAIYLEAQSHLQELLKEYKKIKLKRSPEIAVNIRHLAVLTMGKSISETVEIISGLLLYEGYSDVSRKKLEAIYMAVKDEQLKINNSADKLLQREVGDSLTGVSEKPKQVSRHHSVFIPPENELTEEFFIGKKVYTEPKDLAKQSKGATHREGMYSKAGTSYASQFSGFSGVLQPDSSSVCHASSSNFDPVTEYNEEFFTGRKFRKPQSDDDVRDPKARSKLDDKVPSAYISRRHILIPPAPIISDTSSQNNSPKPEVDFEAVKKCLAALKNGPF